MRCRLVVTPQADREIDLVAAAFGRGPGGRFTRAVRATFRRLRDWPDLGEPLDFAAPELAGARVLTVDGFPSHLVLYRHTDRDVTILHVVHGARDLEALFGPRAGEGPDQP